MQLVNLIFCSGTPLPLESATCTVSGHSSFKTFDDRHFMYPGRCTYQLAADCVDNSFQIHAYTDPKCVPDPHVPCRRSVNLYLGQTEVNLKLDQQHTVTINGANITLPHVVRSLVIKRVSNYVIVAGFQGLTVYWDGHTGVSIKMEPKFANKTCGMCGNYNGNPGDDLRLPNGKMSTSVAQFGNNWKKTLVGETCPNVFDKDIDGDYDKVNATTKEKIDFLCERLWRKTEFKVCHGSVDPAPYIKQCKNDVAACKLSRHIECVCDSFTQYSRACTRKNIVLDWRSAAICRKYIFVILYVKVCQELLRVLYLNENTAGYNSRHKCDIRSSNWTEQ